MQWLLHVHLCAMIAYVLFYIFLQSSKKLEKDLEDDTAVLGVARGFMHYCRHNFYFKDNQLVDNLSRIYHLPLIIVHGRYDIITLPKNAYELHTLWTGSELFFAEASGHASTEKNMHILLNLNSQV